MSLLCCHPVSPEGRHHPVPTQAIQLSRHLCRRSGKASPQLVGCWEGRGVCVAGGGWGINELPHRQRASAALCACHPHCFLWHGAASSAWPRPPRACSEPSSLSLLKGGRRAEAGRELGGLIWGGGWFCQSAPGATGGGENPEAVMVGDLNWDGTPAAKASCPLSGTGSEDSVRPVWVTGSEVGGSLLSGAGS